MAKDFYTTSEAAKLLAVSPDTVLRWVKAGKVRSHRTPGGHCRIPRNSLEQLVPKLDNSRREEQAVLTQPAYQYCWDFGNGDGIISDGCRNCVSFRSRARRCYELRKIPQQFEHLNLECPMSCAECEYYRIMKERGIGALIVSRNRRLTEGLKYAPENPELALRFADSEYDCAAVIDKFRPDYVVLDSSFGTSHTREICQHLLNDPRLPLTRIVLTSKTSRVTDCRDGEIFAWISKPFTARLLQEMIDGAARV
jgi:excisionase family DNA binding protein